MKPMLGILRKDLRLSRLPLVVWLLVLAGEAVFVLSGLDARTPVGGQATTFWDFGFMAFVLAHIAVALVLGVGVVQADGPMSASAFWRTRPVGRWSVLGAKLLFTFGAVLIPWVLVDMVVLVGRGASLADALSVGSTTLLFLTAFALPLLCVAALASTLSQTLLLLVAIVGYAVVAGKAVFAVLDLRFVSSLRPEARVLTLVAVLTAILLGGLSLAAVYARSRRAVAVVVLVGIPAAVGFVFGFVQVPSPRRQFPASLRLAPLARRVPLTLGVSFRRPPLDPTWPMATAARVVGIPPGQRVEASWVAARVTRDERQPEDLVLHLASYRRPQHPDLETRTLDLADLGPTTVFGAWDTIWIPCEKERPSSPSEPAQARVRLLLVRDRIVGRVPLRAGASMQQSSLHTTLRRDSAASRGEITLHETKPDPVLGLPSRLASEAWEARALSTRYWLHNAGRQEAVVVRRGYSSRLSVPPVALGLSLSRVSLEIEWPDQPRWRDQAAREEWLKDAEVLKTEATILAAGELAVPRFE